MGKPKPATTAPTKAKKLTTKTAARGKVVQVKRPCNTQGCSGFLTPVLYVPPMKGRSQNVWGCPTCHTVYHPRGWYVLATEVWL